MRVRRGAGALRLTDVPHRPHVQLPDRLDAPPPRLNQTARGGGRDGRREGHGGARRGTAGRPAHLLDEDGRPRHSTHLIRLIREVATALGTARGRGGPAGIARLIFLGIRASGGAAAAAGLVAIATGRRRPRASDDGRGLDALRGFPAAGPLLEDSTPGGPTPAGRLGEIGRARVSRRPQIACSRQYGRSTGRGVVIECGWRERAAGVRR